jgi:membrane protein
VDGERSTGVGTRAETPTDIPRSGWKQILGRVVVQLREDHVSLLAAGVAFKALLALFPALIAAVSVWGLLADPATITQQISGFTEALPDDAAGIIESQLTDIAGADTGALSGALVVSVLLALWSASAGMAGLMEGCNAAYNEVDERPFPRKRGLALAFTLGAIVFLFVTLAIIAVLPPVLEQLGLGSGAELVVRILQWPLLAVIVMGAIALVYRYAPDRDDPQFRWATGGAILATVLWLLGSAAFTIYVEVAGNFARTYGALAGVIVLMLWLYLTAFVILLGAEFNAETERQTLVDTTVGAPEPMGHRGAVVADTPPPPAATERRRS